MWLFPPPLWGRAREGAVRLGRLSTFMATSCGAPTLPLPHNGGGERQPQSPSFFIHPIALVREVQTLVRPTSFLYAHSMAKSTIGIQKLRGRPKVGKTPISAVRLPDGLRAKIDAWIAAQSEPRPSRSEAIRRLVEQALGGTDAGFIAIEDLNASNDE